MAKNPTKKTTVTKAPKLRKPRVKRAAVKKKEVAPVSKPASETKPTQVKSIMPPSEQSWWDMFKQGVKNLWSDIVNASTRPVE